MLTNPIVHRVRKLAPWLFAVGLTGILLGYQTTLFSDPTPSQAEEMMLWLTSRTMLILTMVCGYLGARSYQRLIKEHPRRSQLIIGGWLTVLSVLAVSYYLITGDTTFLALTVSSAVLVAAMNVRARWVLSVLLILLLNLPAQLGWWIQANRNYPMPASEHVNQYETAQYTLRHERAQAAQHWLDRDYASLIRYYASIWVEQWLEQSSRWSVLIGSVLLGMGIRRWRRLVIRYMTTIVVGVAGLCGLATVLELSSGRVLTTTLQRYADSYRYPGYYVFDVPDALYLTVSGLACLSMALLISIGLWMVSRMSVPNWVPLRRPAL